MRLVGVLSGACMFLADLARQLDLDVSIDFIAVASYERQTKSSGEVKLLKDLDASIEGLNVILVEDVLDSGRTADYLSRLLGARRPKQFRMAVLLDKQTRRRAFRIRPDYVGFEIPSRFVVGYGLDWAGRFRHLRDVCAVAPGPNLRAAGPRRLPAER